MPLCCKTAGRAHIPSVGQSVGVIVARVISSGQWRHVCAFWRLLELSAGLAAVLPRFGTPFRPKLTRWGSIWLMRTREKLWL